MSDRILFVDDEPNILTALRRQLYGKFQVDTALGPQAGLEKIRSDGPFAVVVSDLRMPGMDGVQFLAAVHDRSPDTVRVMLTGCADVEAAIAAVNEGNVFRFLVKPVEPGVLVNALNASIQQYHLVTAERDLLQKTLSGSVRVLMDLLSLANPLAFSRAMRISRYVREIAGQMMIPNAWQFELAALLSQIGCVALPADILEKIYSGQELSDDDRRMFLRHPAIAREMLVSIPRMDSIANMIARQHEPTGSGDEPRRRDAVDFGAQMLGLALEFDSLVTAGTLPDEAIAQIRSRRRYDPVFLAAMECLETEAEPGEEKLLRIQDLEIGMTLAQPVRTHSGTLLVTEGQEVTVPVLNLLQCWGERGEIDEPIRVMVGGTA